MGFIILATAFLYRGGVENDDGSISPDVEADDPDDGAIALRLVDEEPADDTRYGTGANGSDEDGDGEDDDGNPFTFAIADVSR